MSTTVKSRCYVGSEVGQLRRVLLHHPHLSLERLTPSNSEDLLFDDVLKVEAAEREHSVFSNLLQSQGVEVLLLKDLLAETMEIEEAREWLLLRQSSSQLLGSVFANEVRAFLREQTPAEIADYLLGGITCDDLGVVSDSLTQKFKGEDDFILPPLPNHMFTRDTSCWIANGVSINPMAKSARKRESMNLRAIYHFHPLFAQADFSHWYGNSDDHYENATLEGGDIAVIGHGIVLAGLSERTTPQGVELLATSLFGHNAVKEVIAVELPKARSSMHLDTVMTMLDRDCFTVFPPVTDHMTCWSLTPRKNSKRMTVREIQGSLFNHLSRSIGVGSMRLIPTGGDRFQREREQWNDANNVLAVKPGTVIAYERNTRTIANMQDAGIEVLTIPGNELGRGRGGPHCMSCPIERED